jgi:hypothetical protein
MLVAGAKGGLIHRPNDRQIRPRLDMIPFESEHMFRATLHALGARHARFIKSVPSSGCLSAAPTQLAADGNLAPLDAAEIRPKGRGLRRRGHACPRFRARHVADDHDDDSRMST